MKTLHLNLKRKWFNMIFSGDKKEEYREIKDFWIQRLFECKNNIQESILQETLISLEFFDDLNENINKETYKIQLQNNINEYKRKYDTITFSNGYTKDRRQFEIELNRLEISKGKKRWGAKKNETYFVLHLGNIISSKNCGLPF